MKMINSVAKAVLSAELFVLTLIILVLALAMVPTARAQVGFGLFDETRQAVVMYPQIPAVNANLVTNPPFDLVPFTGRSILNITALTNGAGPVATESAYLLQSPDTTNWTPVANYAVINSTTSYTYTNFYYGFGTNGSSGLFATNYYLWPYTLTTPVAFSSLFATPYPAYNLFTNTGPVTLNCSNTTVIGLPTQDLQRYLQLVITNAGNGTNGKLFLDATFVGTPKTTY